MELLASAGFRLVQSTGRVSPILVALILAALIIFLLWLVLRLFAKNADVQKLTANAQKPAVAQKQPVIATAAPAAAPAQPDNLEIIEGIGPKIAGVLCGAGVTTFAQLAAMEPAKISELLHAGGIRLADPRTWPDQARLAAAGDTDGLKALQENLKAGRVV